jgi:hypothetical protein
MYYTIIFFKGLSIASNGRLVQRKELSNSTRHWTDKGHVIRMEDDRFPKKVLNGRFHNARPVGRPRGRWVDAVQRDSLQILGTRGWRRRTENRDEWRHLLREAKARKGAVTPYMDWTDKG